MANSYFGLPVWNPYRSDVPRGFYGPSGHTGLDLGADRGTPLSLPITTTVKGIRELTNMGWTLFLEDKDGNLLVFAHADGPDSIPVAVGDTVKPNQTFYHTGNTGLSTGPHLHFEIITKEPRNPIDEAMKRYMEGAYMGYNTDPAQYLDEMVAEVPENRWWENSMNWMKLHGIVTQDHDPKALVTWAELSTVSQRLATKTLEWARGSQAGCGACKAPVIDPEK